MHRLLGALIVVLVFTALVSLPVAEAKTCSGLDIRANPADLYMDTQPVQIQVDASLLVGCTLAHTSISIQAYEENGTGSFTCPDGNPCVPVGQGVSVASGDPNYANYVIGQLSDGFHTFVFVASANYGGNAYTNYQKGYIPVAPPPCPYGEFLTYNTANQPIGFVFQPESVCSWLITLDYIQYTWVQNITWNGSTPPSPGHPSPGPPTTTIPLDTSQDVVIITVQDEHGWVDAYNGYCSLQDQISYNCQDVKAIESPQNWHPFADLTTFDLIAVAAVTLLFVVGLFFILRSKHLRAEQPIWQHKLAELDELGADGT